MEILDQYLGRIENLMRYGFSCLSATVVAQKELATYCAVVPCAYAVLWSLKENQ